MRLIIFASAIFFIIALLAIAAAILFAIQIDSSSRGFSVSRGVSFYLQVGFSSLIKLEIAQFFLLKIYVIIYLH